MSSRISQDEFIRRVKKLHGNSLDFSKSVFTKVKEPVTVVCPVHGEYLANIDSLLQGCGCIKCAHIRTKTESRITIDEIKQRAGVTHGVGKFDYTEAKYINVDSKILLRCLEHDILFEQRVGSHMRGKAACPKCKTAKLKSARTRPKCEFIDQAYRTHKGVYSYEEVDYCGCFTPVRIYCTKCERYFYQRPHDHLRGCGCSLCNKSGFSSGHAAFIYVCDIEIDGQIITGYGITKNIKARSVCHKANAKRAGASLNMVFVSLPVDGPVAACVEQSIKKRFVLSGKSMFVGFIKENTQSNSDEVTDYLIKCLQQTLDKREPYAG